MEKNFIAGSEIKRGNLVYLSSGEVFPVVKLHSNQKWLEKFFGSSVRIIYSENLLEGD